MDPNRFKLYDNFILMSNIEHHCLACNESLADEYKIAKHINKKKHIKKAQNMQVVSGYAEDKIYEVYSQVYYCKYCNKCVSGKSLKLHVTITEQHKIGKKNPGIIVGRSTKQFQRQTIEVIGQDLYNGIIGLTCYVCNNNIIKGEEYKHIKDISHRIHLLQMSNFEDDGVGSYRQVADKFICHVCQEVYKMIDKDAHFLTQDHLKRLECDKTIKRPDLQEGLTKKVDSHPIGPPRPKSPLHPRTCKKDEIATIESHPVKDGTLVGAIFMLNEDYYDFVKEHGVFKPKCKTCGELRNLSFKDMLDHKIGHEKNIVDREIYNSEEALSRFVNVRGRRYYFCRCCFVHFSTKISQMTEHFLGVSHRAIAILEGIGYWMSEDKETMEGYKIVTIERYVTTFYDVPELQMCLINGTICINKRSFLCVTVRHENKNNQPVQMACYICNEIFPADEEMDHYGTVEHYQAFLCARVVTTLEGEFIRELSYQKFHCGYCNKKIGWRTYLEKHLESWKHQKAKKKNLAMGNLLSSWYGFGTYVRSMNYPKLYVYMITSIEDIMNRL